MVDEKSLMDQSRK